NLPTFDSQQTELTWGQNKLSLNGGLAANTWSLVADVQLEDMAQLSAKTQGQVHGQLIVQGEHQHPSMTIDLHGKEFGFDNKIAIDNIALAGKLNQLGQQQSDLQMTVHNMAFAERIVPDAAIAIKGTQDNHQLIWQLLAQPVVAEGALQGALDSQLNWQGQSNSGLVKVGDFLWILQNPFDLVWSTAKKQVLASEHCWLAEQAQLCNQDNLTLSPQQAHINIALKDLEISRLSALLPEDLAWQGSLEGQATVDWQANQLPQLNARLVTNNGEIGLAQEEGDAITLPYHQLRLTAHNNEDNHIAVRFDMQAPNMGQGYIDARIDSQSSPYQMNGAMLLEKVNLAILKPFMPNMRHLAGEINLSGGLTGEITRLDFYGEFSLKDGEILAKNNAIDVSQTNIEASIRGKNATIKGALKSGGGTATLQGNAQWREDVPNLQLNVEGQHIDLVQKPLFTAKVSPNIKLNIQPYLVDIKGDALVEEALLQPQTLANNAVPLSADVRVVDWLNKKRVVVKKTTKQWDINTDIELVMGDKVFFNGFGLQSKLLGNLKLKQQKQRGMQAIGEIQLDKEAKYEAYGQRLNIRQGQILFAGSISQPALAIEAIKEVDGKIVGVRVDGRANLPNLTLFADTPMSQD
ncbi:MAG: translocation/assembly module TamB domain-containing protein, partial [Pseudomonadales bacterium]|nr:translocation/assembly module TamB domain-containing protein [Pseudomonadales bacterium]